MAEVLQKLSVKRFTATSCNRPGTPREGMWIGEAMRLDRDDIDWDDKVLVVRSSKFGRSREVACHDSTIDALQAYSARRDRLCPRPASASFFVSQHGLALAHHSIYPAFHQLAREAGLPAAGRPRPQRARSAALLRGRDLASPRRYRPPDRLMAFLEALGSDYAEES